MPRTLAAGPMPETDRCRPSLSFPASSVAAEDGDLLSSTRGSREAASRTWLAPSVPARESPRVPPNNLKRKPGDLFKAQARAPESMVRPHPLARGNFQFRKPGRGRTRNQGIPAKYAAHVRLRNRPSGRDRVREPGIPAFISTARSAERASPGHPDSPNPRFLVPPPRGQRRGLGTVRKGRDPESRNPGWATGLDSGSEGQVGRRAKP